MDGIFPRRRRDGDGCGDAAVPSDRRRRRLRRDERGGGDDKGQASGDDSPSRRDASELEAWWWRGMVIIDKSWFFVSESVQSKSVLSKFYGALKKIPGYGDRRPFEVLK